MTQRLQLMANKPQQPTRRRRRAAERPTRWAYREELTMSKWIDQILESQIAERGDVVRRKISSIDKEASQAEVKQECAKRGYHIVQPGDQWLIFCDKASVKIIG